jgi:hypothetical protein
MSIRQHQSVIGLFIIPVVMILIWIGIGFGSENQFTASQSRTVWYTIHGISLLLGTAVVALGFVFGVVYLMQADRLKRKLPQTKFRLPSLEWLQRSSEKSLFVSALLLALGLISGIAINQVQTEMLGAPRGVIAWSDPVIWSSGILFAWLFAATTFNLFYRPARQGRKVAYLVVTSFLFLILELGIVWWAGHASGSGLMEIQNAAADQTESIVGTELENIVLAQAVETSANKIHGGKLSVLSLVTLIGRRTGGER